MAAERRFAVIRDAGPKDRKRCTPAAQFLYERAFGIVSGRLEDTVDATRGQPLAERVLARKEELEGALTDSARNRRRLEIRLGSVRRHSLGMSV